MSKLNLCGFKPDPKPPAPPELGARCSHRHCYLHQHPAPLVSGHLRRRPAPVLSLRGGLIMDTTTFIFVLIGASTAADWLFKIVDMIERRPRHEAR